MTSISTLSPAEVSPNQHNRNLERCLPLSLPPSGNVPSGRGMPWAISRYIPSRHPLPSWQKEIQRVWLHRTMENGLENERSRDPEGTKLATREETEQAGFVVLTGLMRLSSGLIRRSKNYTFSSLASTGKREFSLKCFNYLKCCGRCYPCPPISPNSLPEVSSSLSLSPECFLWLQKSAQPMCRAGWKHQGGQTPRAILINEGWDWW